MIGPDSMADTATAVRRACDELSRRLRSGVACGAEEFLAAEPAIGSDTDAVLELLYTEFVVRQQLGEQPGPLEWLARFPLWRVELAELFEVHALVDDEQTLRTGLSGTQREVASTTPGYDCAGADRDQGRFLGGYEILQEIGRGGMGVVYQARQRGLGRIVALKMILPPHGERERTRFRTEAEATARLSHPNIVPIYEVGQDGDRPFLSMEFVAGKSLDKQLADALLAPRSAAELLQTLARAVAHAHEQGIIHRDLKPANIVLTADGTPKITDFGLASQLMSEGEPKEPRSAAPPSVAIVGTPSYMAPEQGQPGSSVGPVADVYALGAILYEALTGRPPFRGQTALDILELVRSQEPVPPSRLAPKIPRDLETICLKCLAKQPPQRYASATALAEDLRRFLAGEPILARPVGRTERALRWCQRNPAVAALAGGIVLLLVCGTAVSTSLAAWALSEKSRANQHAQQELAARELAEQRFAQAEKAVGDYLDGIENHDGLKEADFFDLRKQLLSSAVPFYEDFIQARPGDAALEAKRGLAYKRLALIHVALGEREQAIELYRRVQSIFQKLTGDFPNVPEYPKKRAIALHNLGRLLNECGQATEAAVAMRQTVVLWTKLTVDHPDDADYRAQLGHTLTTFGVVQWALGNRAAAEDAYRRAIVLHQALVQEFPKLTEYRWRLATGHTELGIVLWDKLDEFETELRAAHAFWQELSREHPQKAQFRRGLARSHYHLGTQFFRRRQWSDAETEFQLARSLQQTLVADFRSVHAYRFDLAHTHSYLGRALDAQKKRSEALAEHRLAVELGAQLVEQFPTLPTMQHACANALCWLAHHWRQDGKLADARDLYLQAIEHETKAFRSGIKYDTYSFSLQNNYHVLGDIALRQKDHALAAEAARQLSQVRPDVADDSQLAARFFGRCVMLAEQDPALSEIERQTLAKSYADQAMEHLREAVRRGYDKVASLKSLTALAPLRDRPDFQQLVHELETR